MTVYTFSKAHQNFAAVLKKAKESGRCFDCPDYPENAGKIDRLRADG